MKTRDRQVSKLIDVLSRRSDVAFERFIRALVHTHQDDVAILLDPDTARDLIESRNSRLPSDQQGTFDANDCFSSYSHCVDQLLHHFSDTCFLDI